MKKQNVKVNDPLARIITLPCYDIVVRLTEDGGGGSISSDLHEGPTDEADDPRDYNCAMDGLESLILAHACAGVDIESPAYIEGVESAVQACANNL